MLVLCCLGGLQLAGEQREDAYHFLVFTDVFGNRTHGVVVQYHRPVQVWRSLPPEWEGGHLFSHWPSALSGLSGRHCPEWSQVEFIEVSPLCPLCCVHHLQIPLLQCSEGLFIMVGIFLKSVVLV